MLPSKPHPFERAAPPVTPVWAWRCAVIQWRDEVYGASLDGIADCALLDRGLALLSRQFRPDPFAPPACEGLLFFALASMPRLCATQAGAILGSMERFGIDSTSAAPDGRSALHHAALHGYASGWILALLARGHDPAAPDAAGDTPLHHCAAHGSIEGARALLFGGAPLSALNCGGLTPEQVAIPDIALFLSSQRERPALGDAAASSGSDSGSGRPRRL